MKKVMPVLSYIAGIALITWLFYGGIVHFHQGANDRLHAASSARAAKLREVPVQRKLIEQRRQDGIRVRTIRWGGPEKVMVVDRALNAQRINGKYYTTTRLKLIGSSPTQVIQRLVPTELTDHSQLKFWWCKTPSQVCDPAIGFSTAIDDQATPYDQELVEVNKYFDNQLAGLPTADSLKGTKDQRPSYLWGSVFHGGFVLGWLVLMIGAGFLFLFLIPRRFEGHTPQP